jgi:hypothetical protein
VIQVEYPINHGIGNTDKEKVAFVDYNVPNLDLGPSGVINIPVDPGKTIREVRARVKTAFNGTTPTVKIGDAADDDGFLLTTDLDLTSVGAIACSGGLGSNAYAKGRHFAAAGKIVLTFAGTGVTVGKIDVHVVYAGEYAAPARNMVS